MQLHTLLALRQIFRGIPNGSIKVGRVLKDIQSIILIHYKMPYNFKILNKAIFDLCVYVIFSPMTFNVVILIERKAHPILLNL